MSNKKSSINNKTTKVDKYSRKEIWSILVTYGENEHEEIDNEWESLIINRDFKVGDVRVENENRRLERMVGTEGETTKYNNGERMIQLWVEINLLNTNTTFWHKNSYKYTRVEHNRNQ